MINTGLKNLLKKKKIRIKVFDDWIQKRSLEEKRTKILHTLHHER